jgi:hypothetical protein
MRGLAVFMGDVCGRPSNYHHYCNCLVQDGGPGGRGNSTATHPSAGALPYPTLPHYLRSVLEAGPGLSTAAAQSLSRCIPSTGSVLGTLAPCHSARPPAGLDWMDSKPDSVLTAFHVARLPHSRGRPRLIPKKARHTIMAPVHIVFTRTATLNEQMQCL